MQNLAYAENADMEIINGKTIMMSPRPSIDHNLAVTNITRIFATYLHGKKCVPFTDGVEVHLGDNLLIPDAMIVCNQGIIKRRGIFGPPDLVVEVLSPYTAKRDIGDKKDVYEKYGVKEYWLIDPRGHSVTVYVLQGEKFVLDNVYHGHSDEELNDMTDEEKEITEIHLKVSLYDDFIINVNEIFERLF